MRTFSHIRLISCFAVLLLFAPSAGKAQEVNYKAYSVYVYNFIKYIEWPEQSKNEDFVIAVIGNSPILKELKTLAATKKANGHTIVVKQFDSYEEVDHCQIIYISGSVKNSFLKATIEKAKSMSALLITEREGQAKKGAGINFVTEEDDTLKFEVNRKVIEGNKLKISNALMTLGLPVG